MAWTRRARAALQIAALWGVAWGAIGAMIYSAAMLRLTAQQQAQIARPAFVGGSIPATAFLLCGLLGAAVGLMFALFITTTERQGRVGRYSAPRFALWGALAGVGAVWLAGVPYGSWAGSLIPALICAACGGISAAGTVMAARVEALPRESTARRIGAS